MSGVESVSEFRLSVVLAFVIWVVYQLVRLCLGLVVHPYRTTREIMRGKWFVPLVFLPSGILVWIVVTGRIGAFVVDVPSSTRDVLGVLYSSFILSLVLWQGLLFYLAVRFRVGLKR